MGKGCDEGTGSSIEMQNLIVDRCAEGHTKASMVMKNSGLHAKNRFNRRSMQAIHSAAATQQAQQQYLLGKRLWFRMPVYPSKLEMI